MSEIFRLKHELWLKMLFSSFALKNAEIKDKLYDFSQILFRHMKWIAKDLKQKGIEYDYDKGSIDIEKKSNFEFFEFLAQELQNISKYYEQSELYERIKKDEEYMLFYVRNLMKDSKNDAEIIAFDKSRVYEDKKLSKSSTDALTVFLFEETYKEYELIMVYTYMQNFTEDLREFEVYQDLVDESHFHLKSFGEMLSKMGILSIPRVIPSNIYKVTDITKFLEDGIKEEEAAKEECIRLASAVNDEELGKFFDFINYQESYHIELMKKLL